MVKLSAKPKDSSILKLFLSVSVLEIGTPFLVGLRHTGTPKVLGVAKIGLDGGGE